MIHNIRKSLKAIFNLLFILIVFSGCSDNSNRQTSEPPADVEQEVSRFNLVQSRDGHTRWRLNADMATFLEGDRIRLVKAQLLIFGNKEGQTLTIHGDQGEVDQRSNDIKVSGNVEGTSSDGGRFSSAEVYWREETGKIYTMPGVKVTITYEDSIIVGEELEADPELEIIKLKNIKGITRAEEKKSETN